MSMPETGPAVHPDRAGHGSVPSARVRRMHWAPVRRWRLRRLRWLLGVVLLSVSACALAGPAATEGPRLGRVLDASALERLRPTIFPDGQGLPPGQGGAEQGAQLYQSQCGTCHGRHAEGATAPELIGGAGPLSAPDADKTLLTYWPYATTLYDTIQRAMPPAAPGLLTPAEIYSLCAWLLAENGLWSRTQPLDGPGLAGIKMPNRGGFIRPGAPLER